MRRNHCATCPDLLCGIIRNGCAACPGFCILLHIDLEEIKERYRSATPGPWISMLEDRDHTCGEDFIMRVPKNAREEDLYLNGTTRADQEFIAHARSDIPQLVIEIERVYQCLGISII